VLPEKADLTPIQSALLELKRSVEEWYIARGRGGNDHEEATPKKNTAADEVPTPKRSEEAAPQNRVEEDAVHEEIAANKTIDEAASTLNAAK